MKGGALDESDSVNEGGSVGDPTTNTKKVNLLFSILEIFL